ncbi:hypothetical protein FA95DRAFT_1600512 [Auriscalpium vulgare]|uniref:Uncharacterized protein n=1 Tax=Auriscalpium vulgare TaxID=40419 RepID=A0ACB8SCX5_9AGAM|nr:hypothetical protein FA95DRAFT_1600512 [Auriscalpium vulgare]
MNRPALLADKIRLEEFFKITVQATDHCPYLYFALEHSPSLVRHQITGLKAAIEGSASSLEDHLEPCTGQDSGDRDELTAFLTSANFPILPPIEDFRSADLRFLHLGVLKCLQSRVMDYLAPPSEDALVPFAEITSLAALFDSLVAKLDPKMMAVAAPSVQTLRESVATVARYALGAVAFVKSRRKPQSPAREQITLSSLPEVVESWAHSAPETLEKIIGTRWKDDTVTTPVLHAEIRLFHFTNYEILNTRISAGDGRFRIGSGTDTCACCEMLLRSACAYWKRAWLVHATGRFLPDWGNTGSSLYRRWEDEVRELAEASLVSLYEILIAKSDSYPGLVNKDCRSCEDGPDPLENARLKSVFGDSWEMARKVLTTKTSDKAAADTSTSLLQG